MSTNNQDLLSQVDPSLNPQDLYMQILSSFPYDGKKSAAANATAKLAFAKSINAELGYNPLNYQAPQAKPFTPKPSVVKMQYGNDPNVQDALSLIDKGHSSNDLAAQLIDPATGEVTADAQKHGITTAEATTAVKAAQEYEKEKASTAADQQQYEARQASDPTYERTQGTTGGKMVLPAGDINGWDKPDLQYDQGLKDMVAGLSNQAPLTPLPKIGLPPPPEAIPLSTFNDNGNNLGSARPKNDVGVVPTGSNPAFHSLINVMPQRVAVGGGNFPAPDQAKAIFARLPTFMGGQSGARSGTSPQQDVVNSLGQYKAFADAHSAPQRSAANSTAMNSLLQLMAMQGS